MANSPPKILVFDSGVGGISILQKVQQQLPWCEYIYASDNRAFPYGTKDESELVARVDLVLKVLTEKINPDIVIIACNTASTVALPKIRSHFQKPVVGVVPAIKPAAQISSSKVIGLLATPGTIDRPYTQWLIDDFAPTCQVIKAGSSRLVEIAEEKIRGKAPDLEELRNIIAPLFTTPELDTVVLACTHFPLLGEELASVTPRAIQWVDSGDAIARRVASLISTAPADAAHPEGFDYFLTANAGVTANLVSGLKNFGAREIRSLEI